MWVGDVEVPSDLVDAHRDGRLVLFVGAGASLDAPSNLPNFKELTRTVADEAHYSVNDDDLRRPDIVLGRIKDRGVDVHLRVSEHLSKSGSKHNSLHAAIVNLALTSQQPRIVTTNYDRHLTSVIDARSLAIEEFTAPALPVGSDFTGVVYLHGTLGQDPSRLVMTESDFGKAYLRDAWAARFLERMFAKFSVLFIGYSHSDVVMRYLARALGPDSNRYVLTHTPLSREWVELGLQPIGYELVQGSHVALREAIERWGEISTMGMLDHRRRVADLVSAPPSGVPEDASYIEELITDPERVQLFVELARSPEWLDWASTQPVFQNLFARESHATETGRALAGWFVEFFVMEEKHTEHALGIVGAGGGYLRPEVCDQLGAHLHSSGSPRPEWLGIWLVLLIRDAPRSSVHWLEYALDATSWPEDKATALLLLDYLTEPIAGLGPSYGPGPPRVSVLLRGSHHWLAKVWTDVFRPNLSEVVHPAVAMADRHLRRASDLQISAQPANSNWDAISFGRHGIEPHPQDDYPEPIDVLIDAARDGIEALLDSGAPNASAYLGSWAAADSQLLRRLAIHGWTYRGDVDSSEKLDWLISSRWLFEHRVRHEAFRLIAEALPAASEDAVGALIAHVFEAGDEEPEHRPYERFNALAWMNRSRPNHTGITDAFAKAQAANPDWQERSRPDLTHFMESGFVSSRPPMSIEEFHEELKDDPSSLLSSLKQYQGTSRWEGPTWDDSLALITSAVQQNQADGHLLLAVELLDADVTRAVIRGWASAELDRAAASAVLTRIATLDMQTVVRDVAWMLSTGGRSEGFPTNWAAIVEARPLARELWDLIPEGETIGGEVEWLDRAINHPAGNLAEFWVHVVEHDWRMDEVGWSGLTEEHRLGIEAMLTTCANEVQSEMAQVILASRLHFVFSADQDWAVQNVMPLFDWSDEPRSRRVWNSFSGWGRWNDRMLDAGLMEHYLSVVDHLDGFSDEEKRQILGHLAGIALTSRRDPLEWLPAVIAKLSNQDRIEFADKVTQILEGLPAEAVEYQWAKWMKTYWTNRLGSVPTQLSIDEASAMAGWTPFLTASFESGADLVISNPGRFRQHDDVLRHLEQHVDDSPAVCAQMVAHLMTRTQPPWWGGHSLPKLVPRLRAQGDPEHVRVIIEQALRLGFSNPESW